MKVITSTLRQGQNAIREVFASRILQQAGWLATAKIVQGIASMAASLAIARHLGPSAFGQLSLAIASATFVATAASLGLEHIATRELALDGNKPNGSIIPTLRRLRMGGAIIGSTIVLLASYVPAANSFGISGLLIVLSLLPLAQVGDLAEWQLIACDRSKRIAQVAIMLSPVAAIARIVFVLLGASISTFAWILVAEWSLRSTLLIASTEGNVFGKRIAVPVWISEAKSLLLDSMPLLMAGIAVFIYMRIDQFMIAGMLDSRQLGLYSAVVTLSEVPLILPALLLRAALPTLTRQSVESPAIRDRTLETLMRHVFYLHLAGALILFLLAEPIVVMLYGTPFTEAAQAFRIQVLAAPFVALGVLSSTWLVLERCTGHALRRTLVGAIANVALNLALIPHLGISGAALATLVAQFLSTYLADLGHAETRMLFKMKTRAMLPGLRGLR
ncbi:flippase [Dyella subtropica]|uniref:flippase n=1 Tax=Dyella subtropica TaxID=2992127 RepID=UPI0022518366|nr:flippase [Dyella subtropica]